METLRRIVSGGQTGVDRAALDAAREAGISHGGWCPKGRPAEDGAIDERYPLRETPSSDYPERTEWNVRDADATLILTTRRPTGGTAYTIEMAEKHDKPCRTFDPDAPSAADSIRAWLAEIDVEVLNVAGPRESTVPGIYEKAKAVLEKVLTP